MRREEEKEGEGQNALGQFVHRQTVAIWLKSCCIMHFAYRTPAVDRHALETQLSPQKTGSRKACP